MLGASVHPFFCPQPVPLQVKTESIWLISLRGSTSITTFSQRWEKSHHPVHFPVQRPFLTTGEHSRNKHSKISMTPNHAAGRDLLFLARIKRGKKPQDVFPHFLTVSVIACRGEKLAVRYYSVTSEEVGVMWRKREQRKGHIYPAVAQPQPDNSEPLTPRQFHHPTFSSEFSLSCEEFEIRWKLLCSAFMRYQPFWLQSSPSFSLSSPSPAVQDLLLPGSSLTSPRARSPISCHSWGCLFSQTPCH